MAHSVLPAEQRPELRRSPSTTRPRKTPDADERRGEAPSRQPCLSPRPRELVRRLPKDNERLLMLSMLTVRDGQFVPGDSITLPPSASAARKRE
jgi:hypothetical protein